MRETRDTLYTVSIYPDADRMRDGDVFVYERFERTVPTLWTVSMILNLILIGDGVHRACDDRISRAYALDFVVLTMPRSARHRPSFPPPATRTIPPSSTAAWVAGRADPAATSWGVRPWMHVTQACG